MSFPDKGFIIIPSFIICNPLNYFCLDIFKVKKLEFFVFYSGFITEDLDFLITIFFILGETESIFIWDIVFEKATELFYFFLILVKF